MKWIVSTVQNSQIVNVKFSRSLLAFMVICLVSISEWHPLSPCIVVGLVDRVLSDSQLTGLESGGVTTHKIQ